MKDIVLLIIYNEKTKKFRVYCLFTIFILILGVLYFGVVSPLENLLNNIGLTFEGMYNPGSFVDIISMIVHFSLLPLMSIVGTYIMLKFIENESFKSIRLDFCHGWYKELLLGILVGIVLISLLLVIFLMFDWIDIVNFGWEIKSFEEYIYSVLISMISVALTEEIILRGYIFYILKRSLDIRYSIVITSIIFGFLHINNPTNTAWGIYVIPITLSIAGMLFAISMTSTDSLWTAIGLHYSWNIFLYGIFNLNGGTRSILFVTEIDGPAFFVGIPNTSFGPEVSILGVLVMIIGIVYFLRRNKAQM